MTTFGDRLYQLGGVPVGLGGDTVPFTTGDVFFVDSGAVGTASGERPEDASLTIDAAVEKCTANNGDQILVLPGHAENISTASSLVVDVEGVSIIGLGQGQTRPVLTWTVTGATIEMDAANCRLSNMILKTSISAVTVGINVDADDIQLDNLEMIIDESLDDFAIMIDVDAVTGTKIYDCKFIAEQANAGCNEAIRIDDADYTWVINCVFMGDFTTAGIAGIGATSDQILLAGNMFYNVDSTAGIGIDAHDDATGFITDNVIGTEFITNVTAPLDIGECRACQNFVCTTDNKTGGKATPSA